MTTDESTPPAVEAPEAQPAPPAEKEAASEPKPRSEQIADQRDRIDAHLAKIRAKREADAAADPGLEPKKALDPAPEAVQDAVEHPVPAERSAADLARTALQKSGLKPDLLKGIPEETLIAMGKAAAERQAEQQREAQKIAEERNALAARLEGSAPEAGTPPVQDPGHSEDSSNKQREILERVFPDEEVEALMALLPKPADPAIAPRQPELDATTAHAREVAVKAEVMRARQALVPDHADLSQDGEWEKVVAEADSLLLVPGRYEGNPDPIMAAFREAAVLKGYRPPVTEHSSPASTAPNTRSEVNPSSMTQVDRIGMVLRLRNAGVSHAEIERRVYGR